MPAQFGHVSLASFEGIPWQTAGMAAHDSKAAVSWVQVTLL
jgi:hypothetical protein